MKVASLCAGYGGLELALTHASVAHDLAWWAEIDPAASTVMAAHSAAPNYGDLRAIDSPPPVDLVTAGFPCQPVSTAGQRAGVTDHRWIIRDVVALWVASGARWLLLENVPGLLSANNGAAFGAVLDALAEVGATAQWTHLRAADVGACHRRERWFCLAHADSSRLERAERARLPGRSRRPAERSRGAAPDTDRGQPERWGGPGELGGETPAEPGEGLQRQWAGDAPGDSCPDALPWGAYGPAITRWARIIGRPAPDPTVGGRLNPVFVEWMMGLPEGWVTATALSRAQALKVLGNGVVPQQAAAAICQLFATYPREDQP